MRSVARHEEFPVELHSSAIPNAIGGNYVPDAAIIASLPVGTKVLSGESHGSSAWSLTARLNALTADGVAIRFFVKCVKGDEGKSQLKGEFIAQSELYKTIPNNIPKPYAWGKCQEQSPPTYFFISQYVDVDNVLPDPAKLCSVLADLHQKSASPTGQFGFHIPTYDGKLPQAVGWDSSWTSFFSRLLGGVFELDTKVNGPWHELAILVEKTRAHVIPRLLDALVSDGRSIKPCLIHGDLWEGNAGTEFGTGNLFIFDSCAYYAHHEMELAIWRTEHHQMSPKGYRKAYLNRMELSEPAEEWDDRNQVRRQ
ncbi:MAG: hypothetical protein M1815_001699 [Lichina confinis]|nr:MAG: hypothetical protein M1815_001699 [Lichina confinis]